MMTASRLGVERVSIFDGSISSCGHNPARPNRFATRACRVISASLIIRAGISSQTISNRKSGILLVLRLYLASDLGERDARRTAAETAALRNRSDPLGFYFLSRWLFLFLFLFVRDASLLLLIDPCFRNPNGERSHACDHSNTLRYRNCAARI